MCVSTCYKHSTYRVGQVEPMAVPNWNSGRGLSCSLRGLGLSSGLTQDFVRTGVLDFVLGYCLSPLRGWSLVGVELCSAVPRELNARSRLWRLLDCSFGMAPEEILTWYTRD